MAGGEISAASLVLIYCKGHPSNQQIARIDSAVSPNSFLSLK